MYKRQAIASVLAVKNDIVPPTINHEEGDNDENIDYNLNLDVYKRQLYRSFWLSNSKYTSFSPDRMEL